MLDIIRSPLALKDAQGIWLYTYKHWGEAQANRYLEGLDTAIKKLALSPESGVDIGYLRAGYYRYHVQRHLIIYRYCDTRLEIIRILHEKMDVPRHTVQ